MGRGMCNNPRNVALHQTLNNLATDSDIKVCKFDKGNGAAILDTEGPFPLRACKKAFFVCFIDFFCARFNSNRSLQSKINKKTKNALFHARSGNGP